jgi:deazaflavin-dependent oxidoreductase (nitroreductase family)
MVLPRKVAEFNKIATNRVLGPLAGRAPGLGAIHHTGRKSGRAYRTPVTVFRSSGGWVVALTYGPGADWVRNVLADGGCELEVQGRRVRLTEPRVIHDEDRPDVPAGVKQFLGVVGVSDFLRLSEPAGD